MYSSFIGPRAKSAATAIGVCLTLALTPWHPATAQWWNPFARPAPEPPKAAPAVAPTAPPRTGPPAAAAPGFLTTTPAPAVTAPAGGADSAARIERIEAQIRSVSGQIDQLNGQLAQLRDELRQLQAAGPPGGANPRATEAVTANPRRVAGDAADPAGGSPARAVAGDAPINLAALAARATVANAPGPAGGTAAPNTTAARAGNPRTDYDAAYRHILAGEYADAEKGLRAFLAAYPEDRLAADAEYWLAESLFERALYRDAAEEFVNGYKAFPRSPKAPDTLLKLGLSLQNLGERDAACQTYAKLVKDYPALGTVMLQRVRQEQKNAACQ